MLFIPVYFQHHYSSLQCHMIIILIYRFAAQETFLIIINVENLYVIHIEAETW